MLNKESILRTIKSLLKGNIVWDAWAEDDVPYVEINYDETAKNILNEIEGLFTK